MIKYRIDLFWEGVRVAQLTDFGQLKFGEKFNDFVDCSFSYIVNRIDAELKKYLTAGLEVRIMRQNTENNLSYITVWAGRLSEEPNFSINEAGQETLAIKAEHFGNYYFTRRKLTKNYLNLEETEIAKGVIETLQSTAYYVGFTNLQLRMIEAFGQMEATGNIRSKECKKQDAKAILQQLTQAQDISPNPPRKRGFRLTPDLKSEDYKIFNYFANYGVSTGVVFNNSLISSLSRNSGGKIANLVTAEGKNATKQATSTDQALLDFFGVLEETVSFKEILDPDELQLLCDKELVKRQTPQVVYDLKLLPNNPYVGNFRAGDLVRIEFESGYISVKEDLRVYEISISFDGAGKEEISIKVASDDPISLNNSPIEKLIYSIKNASTRLSAIEKI